MWGWCRNSSPIANTGEGNDLYSGKNKPYGCGLLNCQPELEEINLFEEHESGYSGSELLITMGAGMICGVLGFYYVRKNDKALHY